MHDMLIIGKGKVGNATAKNLSPQPHFHDPAKGFVVNNFNEYKYVLICVDTLQKGPYDYSDIDNVLESLFDYNGTVVIRSTISPDKVIEIKTNNNFNVIIFPEFLDRHDFENGTANNSRIVLGGEKEECKIFLKLLYNLGYYWLQPVHLVSDLEASIIKLSSNAALATKVITFNAIHQICNSYEVDYESVRLGISDDTRIGYGHTIVPSPDDGKLGFGGHCLPKDILAIAEIDQYNFFKFVGNFNKTLGR
jgi:UDP-glucose 6-dehydrogenase